MRGPAIPSIARVAATALCLGLGCGSDTSDFERYYAALGSAFDSLEESLDELEAKSREAGAEQQPERDVHELLAPLTRELVADLEAVRPPPALLESHANGLQGWRARRFSSAGFDYHCSGDRCYCTGDADCNEMFSGTACEPASDAAKCWDIFGVAVCRCERFRCC